MRTSQIIVLALALALMVLSSGSADHIPEAKAKVSAPVTDDTDCQTILLEPAEQCNPAKCQKDCENAIKGGVGTCFAHPLHFACSCRYCPPAPPCYPCPRKLTQMN
nr:uncharacterized protein LOC127309389 [Lolium perenne]